MARMTRPRDIEEAALLAKVLGDPNRMKMVTILAFDGPASVNELCGTLKLPQPTVSHHLGLLRMAKVVETRRAGKRVYCSVHKNLPRASGFRDLTKLLAKLGG